MKASSFFFSRSQTLHHLLWLLFSSLRILIFALIYIYIMYAIAFCKLMQALKQSPRISDHKIAFRKNCWLAQYSRRLRYILLARYFKEISCGNTAASDEATPLKRSSCQGGDLQYLYAWSSYANIVWLEIILRCMNLLRLFCYLICAVPLRRSYLKIGY